MVSTGPPLVQHNNDLAIARFCDAAKAGDVDLLKKMLRARPELLNMELAESDEHRAIHFAVLHHRPEAVRVLMDAGANARQGIYPNRAATTALILATDRDFDDIVRIIEEAEQRRREEASCPNATVTPAQEQLNAAIRAGKTSEAIALLSADETLIKACDRDGASPLHVAAEALNEEIVAWLLARQASVTKTDAAGRTPLDRAVLAVMPQDAKLLNRFVKIAQHLRSRGAPLTLPAAIALDDAERVHDLHRTQPQLLEADVFSVDPLSIAVRHHQIDLVRLLLDLGLDPNERKRLKNLDGEVFTEGSPLWHAALGGDLPIATLLLDRGADPNANLYASGTPTSTAFGCGNQRMQELLTARGGRLSPEFVGLFRQTNRARRLLDGTEPHEPDPNAYSGPTLPEQLLWGAACGGDPEIVRLALQHIDWPRDDTRWFRMAAEPLRMWNYSLAGNMPQPDRSTYPICFSQIIERCDVNLINRQGATLLHRVASDGARRMTAAERVTFATLLLNSGARFDLRDALLKSTPLAWAVRWGLIELLELYLSRGASPTEPDAEDWARPLAWAARYQRPQIARMLESAGRPFNG